jgi:hypothetical protein
MYKNIIKILSLASMLSASVYTASAAGLLESVSKLVDGIGSILSVSVSAVLFSLATLTFFAVVINFIWKRRSGDGKGLEQAKDMLGWTIIGLFVMFSIWGLVAFLQSNLFGGPAATSVAKPQTTWTGAGAAACDGTVSNGVCYPNP